jgi:hypothetical protein
LGFVKYEEFLEQMRTRLLLRKDSAPLTELVNCDRFMSQYSQGSTTFFSAAKHPHHQPPIQWGKSYFLEAKQPECEVSHSPPATAEVKNK